jgi:protein-disulfide isomerase
MPQGTGKYNLYAAAVLGGAVLIGGVLIANELSRINRKLDDVRQDIANAQVEIGKMQQAAPRAAQRRPQRPDPNRRYSVNTAGSPARGSSTAPVKIVEFSDFQ